MREIERKIGMERRERKYNSKKKTITDIKTLNYPVYDIERNHKCNVILKNL